MTSIKKFPRVTRTATAGRGSSATKGTGTRTGVTPNTGRVTKTGRGSTVTTGTGTRTGVTPDGSVVPQPVVTPVGPNGAGFGGSLDPTNGAVAGYGNYPQDVGAGSNSIRFMETLLSLMKGSGSIDALGALLGAGNHEFSQERWDMFYQQLLQMINTQDQRLYDQQLTQDQRKYDWNLLQDSRIYNSPTNELARLMGAGVSRDAAIQILNGGSGSGSVSGGSPVVSPVASAPSVSAPSGTIELQNKQFGVMTAQAAVSMLGQLVDTGLSLAQGVEQVKAIQSQNAMSQMQLDGMSNANQLVNDFQTMLADGLISRSDVEKMPNAEDLIKHLLEKSKTNAQIAQLVNSRQYQGTFGNIFGREYFNRFWKSVRSSRDDGTIADQFIEQQRLNNALSSVNIQKVGAEMSLIGQQEKESEQRVIQSMRECAQIDANIQVLNAQGEYIQVQSKNYQRLVDSQINLNDTTAYAQDVQAQLNGLQYQYNTDLFEINHAGVPMMKQCHIIECERELSKLRFLNDPEGRKKQLITWAQEQDNAQKLAYLNSIYYNAVGDFATMYPNIFALATGFNACGAGDVVKAGSTAAVAAKAAVKAFPKVP